MFHQNENTYISFLIAVVKEARSAKLVILKCNFLLHYVGPVIIFSSCCSSTTSIRAGRAISRDTCYGLDGGGSIPDRVEFSSSPQRLWGPTTVLSNGYRGPFRGIKRRGREANTHLHLVPRLRMLGTISLYIYQ
jgi:hypothetical protein